MEKFYAIWYKISFLVRDHILLKEFFGSAIAEQILAEVGLSLVKDRSSLVNNWAR